MVFEFRRLQGFDWDKGNIIKNLLKHQVESLECEEAFGDGGKVVFRDAKHSAGEKRYILIGKTMTGRLLFIVFTVRKNLLRVVSARGLNKKEAHFYEK